MDAYRTICCFFRWCSPSPESMGMAVAHAVCQSYRDCTDIFADGHRNVSVPRNSESKSAVSQIIRDENWVEMKNRVLIFTGILDGSIY